MGVVPATSLFAFAAALAIALVAQVKLDIILTHLCRAGAPAVIFQTQEYDNTCNDL